MDPASDEKIVAFPGEWRPRPARAPSEAVVSLLALALALSRGCAPLARTLIGILAAVGFLRLCGL